MGFKKTEDCYHKKECLVSQLLPHLYKYLILLVFLCGKIKIILVLTLRTVFVKEHACSSANKKHGISDTARM